MTMTEGRRESVYVPAHLGERSNQGLVTGLVTVMALALAFGVLIAWGARERSAANDARVLAADAVSERVAVEEALATAQEQAEEARTTTFAANNQLDVCSLVVRVSVLQRSAAIADGLGRGQIRAINRLLHRHHYATYDDLWGACDPDHEEE